MPPTVAAAIEFASGRFSNNQASTSPCRRRSSVLRSTVNTVQDFAFEAANQRRADHAAMTGDPNPLARKREDY